MNIKILIASHKKYPMPDDPMYLPIHVGKEGKKTDLGFIGDNTGENISHKNPNYCELTGLYWANKNLDADYIGLVHYRRHFYVKKKGTKFSSIMTSDEAENILKEYDIIVPRKRKYYIETTYSHYIHAHEREGLDMIGDILEKEYKKYHAAYDLVLNRTSAHLFNMFIMKKELFDAYTSWLFEILFKLEKHLDISSYSPYEARVFGFLSERMLDIWLEANNLTYKEVPIMFMENQNWLKKGSAFLKRKIRSSFRVRRTAD